MKGVAVGSYRSEGTGYPSVFNIDRDPREQWNQVGVAAWVIGPYMKIVGQYQQSLKKYPNPPAFSTRPWQDSCYYGFHLVTVDPGKEPPADVTVEWIEIPG